MAAFDTLPAQSSILCTSKKTSDVRSEEDDYFFFCIQIFIVLQQQKAKYDINSICDDTFHCLNMKYIMGGFEIR